MAGPFGRLRVNKPRPYKRQERARSEYGPRHLFGGEDYTVKAGASLPHSILEGATGGGGGGPGPLEIEAAEVAGYVDDFADEEEAGDFAGFHGFAGEFGGVHAAGGDFGFFVAFGAGWADGPGMQFSFEILESKVGPRFRRIIF